jgi:hypothetical protein
MAGQKMRSSDVPKGHEEGLRKLVSAGVPHQASFSHPAMEKPLRAKKEIDF